MRTINPKCSNEDSFKYSILISLCCYELNTHKEKINQLEKFLNNHTTLSQITMIILKILIHLYH